MLFHLSIVSFTIASLKNTLKTNMNWRPRLLLYFLSFCVNVLSTLQYLIAHSCLVGVDVDSYSWSEETHTELYLVHIVTVVTVPGVTIRTGSTLHTFRCLDTHIVTETDTWGTPWFHHLSSTQAFKSTEDIFCIIVCSSSLFTIQQ